MSPALAAALMAGALALVACAPAVPATGPTTPGALPAQENAEGAVTVKITPLNLRAQAPTLDFYVVLDTHSVELNMNLAQQAVLVTDTSARVPASAWPIGNGHHYEATLSFPSARPDGRPVLEGVNKLTLVISNLGGVRERVFAWELSPQRAG